jgi:anti-sigma factor RsiW
MAAPAVGTIWKVRKEERIVDCEESRRLLAGYLDGEFDLRTQAEIASHLSGCANCSREFQSQQSLHRALAAGSLRYEAPSWLRDHVRKAALEAAPASKAVKVRASGAAWRWLALATSSALVFLAVWNIVRDLRPPARNTLADQIVSSHIRSLMLNHATDVLSSDQHTVKPWFDGKLDYSPPVPDLTAEGFPLIGGRLDYVSGRAVAALVYQRRKHIISVYVLPGALPVSQSPLTQNGYNVIGWTANGMTFWAVSDVNREELSQFVSIFNSGNTAASPR